VLLLSRRAGPGHVAARDVHGLAADAAWPAPRNRSSESELADPTRRAILARLAGGEASVKDLAAPFEMTQPAISKHLRVLERAGLIERGRQAQWRPRRLRAGPLRDVADWVGQYRRHWEDSFERLDAYLREVNEQRQEPRDGDDDDRDPNRPG
jgi:DNA-binding transcriptional ArsR family regulator